MPAMLTGELYRNEEPFETFLRRVLQQRSIASALSEHGFKVRSITFHQSDHMATDAARSPAVQLHHPDALWQLCGLRPVHGAAAVRLRRVPLRPPGTQGVGLQRRRLAVAAWPVGQHVGESALAYGQAQQPRGIPRRHGRSVDRGRGRARVPVHPRRLAPSAGRARRRLLARGARPNLASDVRGAVALRGNDGCQDPRSVTRSGRVRPVGRRPGVGPRLAGDHAGSSTGWRGHSGRRPAAACDDRHAAAGREAAGRFGTAACLDGPTAITDVPATIADLAGLPSGLFPGEPALRLAPDARRPRTFAFHSWGNADWGREYMDALHVFSVDGPIHEPGSWRFQQTIADPSGAATRR